VADDCPAGMTTDPGRVASVVSDVESCTLSGCVRSPVRVTVAVVPSPSVTDELASDKARLDGTIRSSSHSDASLAGAEN